jgi:hypothetical protein
LEDADIAVHRVDHITPEEDRDARRLRGIEQPDHLINGSKRRFAAG